MSDLVELERGGDLAAHASEKRLRPLDVLPEPYRKPVGFFWALNKHLLPTPTPLALRFQVWIAKEGLTAAEVRSVLNTLVSPERAAGHRFASDLLADLAADVAAILRQRRQREEQERRRQEAVKAEEQATPAADLTGLLKGIGIRIGDRT